MRDTSASHLQHSLFLGMSSTRPIVFKLVDLLCSLTTTHLPFETRHVHTRCLFHLLFPPLMNIYFCEEKEEQAKGLKGVCSHNCNYSHPLTRKFRWDRRSEEREGNTLILLINIISYSHTRQKGGKKRKCKRQRRVGKTRRKELRRIQEMKRAYQELEVVLKSKKSSSRMR